MDDTLLLLTGAGVFGLMLIGLIFTIVEFRDLRKRDEWRNPEG